MENYGKRMVPEYLVKGLEEAYAKTSGGTGSTINLMENIVDSKGNKRFVDDEGTPATITGITSKYCKWSLSGSHLMLVFAFEIANTTALTNSQTLVTFTLPKYILDKIVPTVSATIVSRYSISAVASDLSFQSISTALLKGSTSLLIVSLGNFTASATRNARMQIDLLIDNS